MPSFYEQVARLLLALVLGAAIGFERERSYHAAGLRTHALVSVGAALIILVSSFGFVDVPGDRADPARVAAQVVSGIGFLGAGAIIVHRASVRGLTTAASLWTVAGLGLAAGAGMYGVSVAATIVVLIILVPMKWIEERISPPEAPSEAEPPSTRASALLPDENTDEEDAADQRAYRRRRRYRPKQAP